MNTKTLIWALGSVAGVLLIVVVALVVNRNPTLPPPAESLVSESNANPTSETETSSSVATSNSTETEERPTAETPIPVRKTQSEPEPLVEVVQPRVSLVGTISALSDGTVFFRVDRVLGGDYACPQAAVILPDPSSIVVGAQYEIEGSYTPEQLGNCRLQLLNPAGGLRLLALPAPTPQAEAPSAADLPSSASQPFFVSAGISFLDPMPLFAGAVGFKLTEQIRGMVTAGFGSSAIEIQLPSGEPISTHVNATLIEVTGLYNVSGHIHLGLSGGMLLLSGDYDLPFPVQGAASFNAGIPLLGAVLGYDLGIGMLTLGIQIPLGG